MTDGGRSRPQGQKRRKGEIGPKNRIRSAKNKAWIMRHGEKIIRDVMVSKHRLP